MSQNRGQVHRELSKFALAALLGIVVGGVCGAAILSFGALIGRSGTTGTEYVGYWSVDLVWLGLLYGGLFGVLVTPIAYLLQVRKVGITRVFWQATLGTLVGGFLGAIAGPPQALVAGIGGFIVGVCLREPEVRVWRIRHSWRLCGNGADHCGARDADFTAIERARGLAAFPR